MNILVTGGCGFIGSNFINYYLNNNKNVKIINLDALYYCANINNIEENIRNSNNYKFIKGNLCSLDLIEFILDTYNIDIIIHFAAQSHVQNSFDDSLQYTKDNVLGTHTLLEAVKKYNKIKKFIHVSTDEVYGESMINKDENKKTESSILCPTNPYAASKAAAEMFVMSYYYSFKIPIIITRGNNVYGPNQYPEKLIPKFIKLLKENNKVTIQGDGSNLRSFLHVNDVVSAFECILEKGIIGEIYNIGADEHLEYSVKDIAYKLIYKIKNTLDYDKWISYIPDRPFNDKRYYISNAKLKQMGWSINTNFDQGLYNLLS
jgi:dTDP-glucose 4,6-dehydratase